MKGISFKLSVLRGALILLPLGLAVYLTSNVWIKVDAVGQYPLTEILRLPNYPGAGIVLLILVCYIMGRISLKEGNLINRMMGRIPIINIFFGENKKILNSTPCQFWRTPTAKAEGFIVGFQKMAGGEGDVIVYFANPPLLITGEIVNLPKRFVIKLANSPKEIMNKLLFFGKVKPEELKPVPWDGESQEELKERINSTPLEMEMRRISQKVSQKGQP